MKIFISIFFFLILSFNSAAYAQNNNASIPIKLDMQYVQQTIATAVLSLLLEMDQIKAQASTSMILIFPEHDLSSNPDAEKDLTEYEEEVKATDKSLNRALAKKFLAEVGIVATALGIASFTTSGAEYFEINSWISIAIQGVVVATSCGILDRIKFVKSLN